MRKGSTPFLPVLGAILSIAFVPAPRAFCQAKAILRSIQVPTKLSGPPDIIRRRQNWFYNQRAYPLKYIPSGARLKALDQFQRKGRVKRLEAAPGGLAAVSINGISLSSTQWTSIGPQPSDWPPEWGVSFSPTSGRVMALAVDPTNSDVVYAGGAEGGVWKSEDGGTTWTPLTDNQPSLAIDSLVIDPSNHNVIYAGTGEGDFAIDAYYGAGILKSTDGGATWTQLKGQFVGPFGVDSFAGGSYIPSIAIDPALSTTLFAGVLRCTETSTVFDCGTNSGLYESTDGGTSWTKILYGTPAMQVMFDPTNPLVIYASFYGAGIYKTTDGGVTWNADNGTGSNVLNLSTAGLISMAMNPTNTKTLYAGVAGFDWSFVGLYKSTDGGANWTKLAAAPDYCVTHAGSEMFPQCGYDNVVAVDPTGAAVLVGGSAWGAAPGVASIWRSMDGGTSWGASPIDPAPLSGSAQDVHPDVHDIVFSSDGSRMYVATDGGVWSTPNVTTSPVTWTNLNDTLGLTQFYPGMSMLPYNISLAYGGTQDNGTQEYDGVPEWSVIGCGDGGWTSLFGGASPSILYWSCVFGEGVYSYNYATQVLTEIDGGINPSDNSNFVPPFVADPPDPQTLYFGTSKVYQSTDSGSTWNVLTSLSTAGDFFTSIAVAPSDPNTVYASTNFGEIYTTSNAGMGTTSIWYNRTKSPLPQRWATQIAVDPKVATTAYASFSGFSGFGDSVGHIFQTSDGGTTWTDISGDLPNIPVNDIVVDPDVPNTLYVATDVGVFEGAKSGSSWTWSPLGTGMPNVAVLSLKLNEASRVLMAGTHGRSAWDLFVPANLPVANFSTAEVDFGLQAVGVTSGSQTVTLTNGGSASMTIAGFSVGGTDSSDFVQTNNCPGTLSAGANCAITLTFKASTRGTFSGQLQVADNAPASPQLVSLTGQTVNPVATLSPTSLSFGNQQIGTSSSAQTITLTDTGLDPLNVKSVVVSGAAASEFSESDNCVGTVNVGASCSMNVTFTPTGVGAAAASLSITDDAANSPQTPSLSGTGTGPIATLSPKSLAFGGQDINSASAAAMVTLTNSGDQDLMISGISVGGANGGDFAETHTCGASLSAGANCTISVTFTPKATGARAASLSITDDASDSPQSVSLSGSGEDFGMAVASGTTSSVTVRAGGTASYSLTLTPLGGFNGTVALACTGAPSKSTCTVPASLSLDGTDPADVAVSVTTTASTELPPGGLPPASGGWPWALWLGLAALAGLAGVAQLHRHYSPAGSRRLAVAVPFAFLVLAMALWASCGGGGSSGSNVTHVAGTPAGNYTLTVTATSGNLSHTTTLTLNVQ